MKIKKHGIAQSVVEFALVLPLILVVLFGILEMGRLIFLYVAVLNASREAARYGSVTGYIGSGSLHQYEDCQGIKDAAKNLGFLANIQDDNISIKYDQGPGLDIAPSAECGSGVKPAGGFRLGSRVLVTVVVNYEPLVPLIPLTFPNITSTSARTLLSEVNINALMTPDPEFFYVEPPSPPTIYSLSPSSGKQAGGDEITITGTDFVAAQVTFGGKGATCTIAPSATIIACKTPSNPAGTVEVVVETPVGTASSSFTYLPVPVIDNISPADGPSTGDTEVAIIGENLKDGTVTIGGLACPVSSSSINQIVCKTPLWPWLVSSSGVDVVVITAGGTSNSIKFHYTETPTITGISPAEGLTSGGYTVTITGNYLSGGSLTFPGCNLVGVSATQVSCTVPAGSALVARRVDVFVTTAFGKSNTVQFNYKPPAPTINSISPSSGLTTGGVEMTITGNNLTYTTESGTITATVTLDGLFCSDPSGTVNQIICSIPAHSARGQVNLVVSSAGGQATATFTYYPPAPTISSIGNDAKGVMTGGYEVTIEGLYLTGATSVSFGGTPATLFTVLSDTHITCVVPAHAVGDVNVVVTTPTPGGGPSNSKVFTYFPPPPIISSMTPLFGLTTVGKTVTINGTYLTGGTVKFGDATATCTVTPDTKIICTSPTIPEPAAGLVYVVVSTPYGSSLPTINTSFNYYKTPVIDSLAPVTGLVIGGESVTITGTGNLTGGTITVGGVNCPVTSSSITSITCSTPAHAAGVVQAIVTTAAGSSNGLDFTYKYGKPSLSSITPNVGTKNTNVVIIGTNLTGGTVKIGGLIETACTLVSDKEITCKSLPTHSNGAVSVTVTNPDGVVSTEPITFTYQ